MNQKGFTLIEILVVMAIVSILTAGIVVSIFQVSWGNIRTTDQVVALADINYATLWLKKDLQMAQSASLTDGDPTPQGEVTLNWIDFTGWATEETRNHTSIYTLSGTDLVRTYDDVPRVVGRYITYIGFTRSDRAFTVVITATSPGTSQQTKTLTFTVESRVETEEGL
ncbi:PilW family protein [Chloroflexota bacterium]